MINGTIHYTEPGIVQNIRAMRRQAILMGIANENITGFDKIGYQRKIPVISSFAEFLGEDAVSTTTDNSVGRLGLTSNPLDCALAEKGYFQVLTKDGIRLTRDGRFKMNKDGEISTLDGAKVLTNMGTPLVLPIIPDRLEDISIDLDGAVRVLNTRTRKFETAGILSVVTPDGTAVLHPNVRQYYNEYSNVNLQTEFLEAMLYPKTFDANMQLYQIQNLNLQKLISSLSA